MHILCLCPVAPRALPDPATPLSYLFSPQPGDQRVVRAGRWRRCPIRSVPARQPHRALFVSVGDGENPRMSHGPGLDSREGAARLDLQGRPAPGNPPPPSPPPTARPPRGRRSGPRSPQPVWPHLVGDRLFAADNGNQMDRFVEIERGRDYLGNWKRPQHRACGRPDADAARLPGAARLLHRRRLSRSLAQPVLSGALRSPGGFRARSGGPTR